MDPNKLYVANIPDDTTQEALRRHFSALGALFTSSTITSGSSAHPDTLRASPEPSAQAASRRRDQPHECRAKAFLHAILR